MIFKVGDRVLLRADSVWSTPPDSSNPLGIKGVVKEIRDGALLPIRVDWDNGKFNHYAAKDLDLVEHVGWMEIVDELGVVDANTADGYYLKESGVGFYISKSHTVAELQSMAAICMHLAEEKEKS